MIGTARLTPVNASTTFRTMVPIALVRTLNLKEGLVLEWNVEIRDDRMVVLVRPAEASSK